MIREHKGFTLVELIIVIVIIGILTIVAVPIFSGYIKKAKQTEAKTLLNQIGTFEKVYHVEHSTFYTSPTTNFDRFMNIDARNNSYFTAYYVNADLYNFSAVAVHTEPLTLTGSLTGPSSFIYYDTTNNN
ncbi:MAG: prepilin-type N-terminal cleavage/methylation domain-containing protein [Elusimicrobia bacterium]|nr:prepilin-type N-terminal cleavage/methylation domain-containing protein [Elusimicrobiota bacterium]